MNELNNNWSGRSGLATALASTGYLGNINGYSGTTTTTTANLDYSGLTLQGNSTITYASTGVSNQNNMSKQVKVAVFTVERNDKNEVKSSKFLKEFWVEHKNGGSIVLAASKQLDKDFDPDTTVIRELQTVSF